MIDEFRKNGFLSDIARRISRIEKTIERLLARELVGSDVKIIQVVHTQTGAVLSQVNTIPFDDSIPQITEGDEYITLAITPTKDTNKLLIEVNFTASVNSISAMIVALFKDAGANALAAAYVTIPANDYSATISFKHEMVAGGTTATTFRVRAGGNAGTMTMNGVGGARRMGGVAVSSIRITEIQA